MDRQTDRWQGLRTRLVKLLISLVEGVDLGEGRRLPGLPWVLEREAGRQGPPHSAEGPRWRRQAPV